MEDQFNPLNFDTLRRRVQSHVRGGMASLLRCSTNHVHCIVMAIVTSQDQHSPIRPIVSVACGLDVGAIDQRDASRP
eukprot:scaffold289290_cov25-Prasinocladus_malaysianus.AAC.1